MEERSKLKEKFYALGWLQAQSENLFTLCSVADKVLDLQAVEEIHESEDAFDSQARRTIMPLLRKRAFLESIILGCAKATEDCVFQIKSLTGKKFDPRTDLQNDWIRFQHAGPGIRGMANVIKHNFSTISLSSTNARHKGSSKLAITAFALPEETNFDQIVVCAALYAKIKPIRLICENYIFLNDVYCHFFKFKQMFPELSENSDVSSVFSFQH